MRVWAQFKTQQKLNAYLLTWFQIYQYLLFCSFLYTHNGRKRGRGHQEFSLGRPVKHHSLMKISQNIEYLHGKKMQKMPMQETQREAGLIPGSGRSPEGGNGNPLQYSCLENSMDRGAWQGYSPWGCNELDMTEPTPNNSNIAYCHWDG